MTKHALVFLAATAVLLTSSVASAQRRPARDKKAATRVVKATDAFELEVRVIEAEGNVAPYISPELRPLAKDLKGLPFSRFTLRDHHRTHLEAGEQMSFQFPEVKNKRSKKKRFLVARAHGEQRGGKLRFQLTIDALGFDTLVAVKDGGTVFVGGPKTADKKNLIFAVTARKRQLKKRR